MPLFVPNDSLTMDLGNKLWRIDNLHHSNYRLYLDLPMETIKKRLEWHIKFLETFAYKWFDAVGTATGIYNYILNESRKSNVLFAPLHLRYEAKAFSSFYLGIHHDGVEFACRMCHEVEQQGGRVSEEVLALLQNLISCKEKAHEMLEKEAERSRKILNI